MDEKSEAQSSASADQYFLEIGGVLHPMSREYYEEIVKPWQDLWDEVLKRQDEQIANYHPRYQAAIATALGLDPSQTPDVTDSVVLHFIFTRGLESIQEEIEAAAYDRLAAEDRETSERRKAEARRRPPSWADEE